MAKKINYTPVSIFAACCERLASNAAMCNPVTAPYAAVIGTTVSAVVGGLELVNEDNNIKESLDEAMNKAWEQIDKAYRLTNSSEDCLSELKREIMGNGTTVDEFIRNMERKGFEPSLALVIQNILEKHRQELNRDPKIIWDDKCIVNAANDMAAILVKAINDVFEENDFLRILKAVSDGTAATVGAVKDGTATAVEAVKDTERNLSDQLDEFKEELICEIRVIIREIQKSKQRILGEKSVVASESSSAPPPSQESSATADTLDFHKVRKLADGLWVNWETGRLAKDFLSVRSLDLGEQADKEAGAGKLSPTQLRLLSVLVQGEGITVSLEELFWRGRLFPKWKDKYAIEINAVDDKCADDSRADSKNADGKSTVLALKAQRKPTREEIEEIAKEETESLRTVLTKFCNSDSGVILSAEDGKGFYYSTSWFGCQNTTFVLINAS